MSLSGQPRVPRMPTPPQGETVARYDTYVQAQKAVDHLADKSFPVQMVTIVGTDLQMVERVTGRLSYPRAASGGFVSGAWFGLFVGLLMSFFSEPGGTSPILPAVLIGGAFGLLFSVLTYSFTRGRRDFTSASQIVASSYAVLCRAEKAHHARQLLSEVGGVVSGWPARPTTDAPAPAAPPASPAPSVAAPPATTPVSTPTTSAPPASTGTTSAPATDAGPTSAPPAAPGGTGADADPTR